MSAPAWVGADADDGACPGNRVQHAVAAAHSRDRRCEGRCDRRWQRARDVHHAEVLPGTARIRKHVGDEGVVNCRVQAEPETAQRHPRQKAVQACGECVDEHGETELMRRLRRPCTARYGPRSIRQTNEATTTKLDTAKVARKSWRTPGRSRVRHAG
jgi:hypothetical protein